MSLVGQPEVRLPGFSTRAIPLNCFFFRNPAKGRPVSEEGVERKLTAILVADVVGYSRLMGEDEAGTLARLKGTSKNAFPCSQSGRILAT